VQRLRFAPSLPGIDKSMHSIANAGSGSCRVGRGEYVTARERLAESEARWSEGASDGLVQ
jgi:hypothetical protein